MASTTTSTSIIPTELSLPSNPRYSWWAGVLIAQGLRRKCSTHPGLIFLICLMFPHPHYYSCCSVENLSGPSFFFFYKFPIIAYFLLILMQNFIDLISNTFFYNILTLVFKAFELWIGKFFHYSDTRSPKFQTTNLGIINFIS